MKKLSFYFLFAGILFVTTASTCSHDDDNDDHSSDPQPVVNAVSSGTWRITYYFDTDSDETNQFSNYDFTFNTNGALTANNGANNYDGTWSVTDSHGGNSRSGDDDSNDLDFNIFFASPSNFAELSDDWDIISYNSSKIQLIDVSGGNGGTDYLTFEKN